MKRSKSPKPEKSLFDTISYFSFFGYAPDFRELFTYFPEKISRSSLKELISRQIKRGKIAGHPFPAPKTASGAVLASKTRRMHPENPYLYTLPQYGMHVRNRAGRRAITQRKLQTVSGYLEALSRLPAIRFAGLTGSAAMDNCRTGADIDLLVVTAPDLLFTGRFLSILLAGLLGQRKKRGGICLNLFFDGKDLAVPERKRSLYTAHELSQVKPVFDRDGIHARLLSANRWVRDYLPNTSIPTQAPSPKAGFWAFALRPVETVLKHIQLRIIRKNRTGHLITPTQLWLFKTDFSTRMRDLLEKR